MDAIEKHKKIGRRSKRKGKTYERFVAESFRPLYPKAIRGIGQARAAGEVPDVKGTPFWIECKHRQKLNVVEALEQAIVGLADYLQRGGSPQDYAFPVVVARLDRGLPGAARQDLVVLRLADFLSLLAGSSGGAPPALPALSP